MIKAQTANIRNYQNTASNLYGWSLTMQGTVLNVYQDTIPFSYDIYIPRWQTTYSKVPCIALGGFFPLLNIQDTVIVLFVDGRKEAPIIIGAWTNTKTSTLYSYSGTKITVDNKGNTVIQNPAGTNVTLDPQGNILLNGGTAGVARVGDTVQVNVNGTIYTGIITSGSTKVKSG